MGKSGDGSESVGFHTSPSIGLDQITSVGLYGVIVCIGVLTPRILSRNCKLGHIIYKLIITRRLLLLISERNTCAWTLMTRFVAGKEKEANFECCKPLSSFTVLFYLGLYNSLPAPIVYLIRQKTIIMSSENIVKCYQLRNSEHQHFC